MTNNNEKVQEVCKQFTRQRKMSVTDRQTDMLMIWSSLTASVRQSRQGTARCFSAIFSIKMIRTLMKLFGTALPAYAVQYH